MTRSLAARAMMSSPICPAMIIWTAATAMMSSTLWPGMTGSRAAMAIISCWAARARMCSTRPERVPTGLRISQIGIDKIELSSSVTDFQTLIASAQDITDANGDNFVIISNGDNGQFVLSNLSIANLSESDFIFTTAGSAESTAAKADLLAPVSEGSDALAQGFRHQPRIRLRSADEPVRICGSPRLFQGGFDRRPVPDRCVRLWHGRLDPAGHVRLA